MLKAFNKVIKSILNTFLINDIDEDDTQNTQLNNEIFAGDTPLHLITRRCTSFNNFMRQINRFSAEEQRQYAITTNNQGDLPIDVINNHLSAQDKDRIFAQLLHIACTQNIKDIHAPVDFAELVKKYNAIPGTELYHNLQSACEIVNKTRALTSISITHPSINGMDVNEQKKIKQKIFMERDRQDNRYDQLLRQAQFQDLATQDASTQMIKVTLSEALLERLRKQESTIENNSTWRGNCYEMARFVFKLGRKRNLNIACYFYEGRGDHVFNVIFDKQSQGTTIDNCGINSVIADSWSGLVCLACEYQAELGDFREFNYHGKHYNVVTKFNPHINKLQKLYFAGQSSSYTYLIRFGDSFIDKLIKPIVQVASPADKYLFGKIIRSNLQKAFNKGLISENEIKAWRDPAFMLKKYFSNDAFYFPLLTYKYAENEVLFRKKIIKALANAIDPNQSDINGKTALHIAVARGYNEIVDLLLKGGADPNNAIKDGKTPLFIAAAESHNNIVELLLDAGADPNKMDVSTPREIAEIMGHRDIAVKLLNEEMKHRPRRFANFDKGSTLFNPSNVDQANKSPLLHVWRRGPGRGGF